jgi:hypothetical protein
MINIVQVIFKAGMFLKAVAHQQREGSRWKWNLNLFQNLPVVKFALFLQLIKKKIYYNCNKLKFNWATLWHVSWELIPPGGVSPPIHKPYHKATWGQAKSVLTCLFLFEAFLSLSVWYIFSKFLKIDFAAPAHPLQLHWAVSSNKLQCFNFINQMFLNLSFWKLYYIQKL